MDSHSASAQRERILKHLQERGSATTIKLRHELDVLAPAPQIFELRHDFDYNIVSTWEYPENPNGGTHKVARYTLLTGKYKEAA